MVEMIFSEDAILMSLLDRGYDDEQDIKDAVLSYCNRGAVSSSAQRRGGELPMKQGGGGLFQMKFSAGIDQQQQPQLHSQPVTEGGSAGNELADVRRY